MGNLHTNSEKGTCSFWIIAEITVTTRYRKVTAFQITFSKRYFQATTITNLEEKKTMNIKPTIKFYRVKHSDYTTSPPKMWKSLIISLAPSYIYRKSQLFIDQDLDVYSESFTSTVNGEFTVYPDTQCHLCRLDLLVGEYYLFQFTCHLVFMMPIYKWFQLLYHTHLK